jgi:Co/Zn/Cd efflux system component
MSTFGGWLTDSKNIDDLNLRGAYLHVLSDALISIFVIFALLMGMMFGLSFLDPVVGIIGGIVIAKWSIGLVKDSSKTFVECEQKCSAKKITQDLALQRVRDTHQWVNSNPRIKKFVE